MKRCAGLLMPISSLPGNQGIGDFGKHTYRLIDAMHKQHIKIWQILPLNPLGYGNSPYQPFSSFAGDEIYISVDTLADYGLLKQSSIRNCNKFSSLVDYDAVRAFKAPYLKKAYKTFLKKFSSFEQEYHMFVSTAEWLYPYAVFISMKKYNHMEPWIKWPKEMREWVKNRSFPLHEIEEQIRYEQFIQFIFYKQWKEIKTYANDHDIQIMGDIPFYAGLDSADVWQHQDEFLLDMDGHPQYVAGVPPDYFSADGQRWGNPIYNWKQMHKDHYQFWIERLSWNNQFFDILRLDHFRAFDTFWKIPATCETAKEGEWVLGPSYDFFDEVYRKIPDINIIAEDLGELRRQVGKLRDHYGLLGMNVLQFEMQPKLLKKRRKEHVVLYPGTHDNNTLEGFYQDISQNQKIALRRFFHNLGYDNRTFHELAIRYCLNSDSLIVILPAQDILGLKHEGRINTPGTIGSPNWEWKVKNLKELYELLPIAGEWIKESHRDQ